MSVQDQKVFKAVAYSAGGALLVHLLAFLFFAGLMQAGYFNPRPPKDKAEQFEITFVEDEVAAPEPEPPVDEVAMLEKPEEKKPQSAFFNTEGLKAESTPNQNATFFSDKNTTAASEAPPEEGSNSPMPTITEGEDRELPSKDLFKQTYTDGPGTVPQPNSVPVPPSPPLAEPPPEVVETPPKPMPEPEPEPVKPEVVEAPPAPKPEPEPEPVKPAVVEAPPVPKPEPEPEPVKPAVVEAPPAPKPEPEPEPVKPAVVETPPAPKPEPEPEPVKPAVVEVPPAPEPEPVKPEVVEAPPAPKPEVKPEPEPVKPEPAPEIAKAEPPPENPMMPAMPEATLPPVPEVTDVPEPEEQSADPEAIVAAEKPRPDPAKPREQKPAETPPSLDPTLNPGGFKPDPAVMALLEMTPKDAPLPTPKPQVKETPPQPEQPAAPDVESLLDRQRRRASSASTSGYRAERNPARVKGGISNKGPNSIDSKETPMGRYQSEMASTVERNWRRNTKADTQNFAIGTAILRFGVTKSGAIKHIEIVSNTSNTLFGTNCIKSLQDTKLPPIPDELDAYLFDGMMDVEYTFSIY